MPYKCARPEVRADAAGSASSAAASAFYDAGQSSSYTTQANAAIQKELTRHALELLRFGATPQSPSTRRSNAEISSNSNSEEDDEPWLLLDLGAGSGLSTLAANEWLLERGLLGFTLAFDISASMLSLTTTTTNTDTSMPSVQPASTTKNGAGDRDTAQTHAAQYDALCLQRAGFYRGNAAQRFPLRGGVFRRAIGISMLQWLTREGLLTCFASLYQQLAGEKRTRRGNAENRAVFQVYPPSVEYVELMEQTARQTGFVYAEVFVSFPHPTTAKKWYFCIERESRDEADDEWDQSEPKQQLHQQSDSHSTATTLCLFGRRFHRRCAWHLLQSRASASSDAHDALASLRERLGREHVKTAWHIWRKYRRSVEMAAAQTPVTHAKAKRSLELWTSDEAIGKALQSRFVSGSEGPEARTAANAVTYDTFLAHMDDVVDILHAAYTDAVAIERALQSQG